jgi:hypothetical protein
LKTSFPHKVIRAPLTIFLNAHSATPAKFGKTKNSTRCTFMMSLDQEGITPKWKTAKRNRPSFSSLANGNKEGAMYCSYKCQLNIEQVRKGVKQPQRALEIQYKNDSKPKHKNFKGKEKI